VARAFRGDHDAVDVFVQLDESEVHAKAVREKEGFALREIRQDILLVNVRLLHVGKADHHHVCPTHRFSGIEDFKAVLLGDRLGLRAGIKADDDLAAAVLQIERMGMALRTVAEDGERFVFKHAEIGVFVGIDFGGHGREKLRVES
jgi:hypothetical protein